MLRLPASPRGFTLVELMVLIVILGLIAAIGVPTFRGYLRANQIDADGDRLAADLALARATSVSQGRIVRFEGADGSYTITDATDGRVIRDRAFDGNVAFVTPETVDFFPWGAASTVTLVLDNGHEQRRVQVLPTGMAEVGP